MNSHCHGPLLNGPIFPLFSLIYPNLIWHHVEVTNVRFQLNPASPSLSMGVHHRTMEMKGLSITRPNWGRYHVFYTNYPPVGSVGNLLKIQNKALTSSSPPVLLNSFIPLCTHVSQHISSEHSYLLCPQIILSCSGRPPVVGKSAGSNTDWGRWVSLLLEMSRDDSFTRSLNAPANIGGWVSLLLQVPGKTGQSIAENNGGSFYCCK